MAGKYSIGPADVTAFVDRLRGEAIASADPVEPDRVVPDDPNDDYLVALALEAEAEYLVTRDRHFEKVRVKGLSIITPGRLVRLLDRA